jgi:hypothetical protein
MYFRFVLIISLGIASGLLSPRPISFSRPAKLHSKLFGEGDFDDGIGDAAASNSDGQAMADEFYKQLRQRENRPQENLGTRDSSNQQQQQQPENNVDFPTLPEEEARFLNREPFTRRKEVQAGKDSTTKFTGRREPESLNYASPFTSSSSSASSSNSSPRTPREQMMEREFQLVGRAEKGIAIQAVFAVLALCFYIFVGVSGGITSYVESDDFGGDDTMPLEEVMPVQTDREVSVWL